MKIVRGILILDPHEDVMVQTPGHIYKLDAKSMTERAYYNNEKVFGVIIDGRYTLCHSFVLNTGKAHFGFIVGNGFGSTIIRLQLITDFNENDYAPFNYDKDYTLGPEVVLKKKDIVNFEY